MMQAVNASRGYDHRDGIYRYRGAYATTLAPWLYGITQRAIRDILYDKLGKQNVSAVVVIQKDFGWKNVASTE